VFIFSGTPAYGALLQVGVDESVFQIGDTVLVTVRINTQGAEINVLEGSLRFNGDFESVRVREISVGGSQFSLWSRKPSWSSQDHSISFVAGEPGGVKSDGAQVFTLALEGQKEGRLEISAVDLIAYLHNGAGTVQAVDFTPLVLDIVSVEKDGERKDMLREMIASDNTPPSVLQATLGSDPSLFGGQLFLSIEVRDEESGIDYLQITEDGFVSVRSGSEYVLQNQDGTSRVEIVAFDKAGNRRVVEFVPREISDGNMPWFVLGAVLILVFLISFVFVKKRRNMRSKTLA